MVTDYPLSGFDLVFDQVLKRMISILKLKRCEAQQTTELCTGCAYVIVFTLLSDTRKGINPMFRRIWQELLPLTHAFCKRTFECR
jgi:hypothetical protein